MYINPFIINGTTIKVFPSSPLFSLLEGVGKTVQLDEREKNEVGEESAIEVDFKEARDALKRKFSSKGPILITVSNNKGGVGKTTLAIQLSAAFYLLGAKVWLKDMDAQANLTCPLLVNERMTVANTSIADVVINNKSFSDITETIAEEFLFTGANKRISEIDSHLRNGDLVKNKGEGIRGQLQEEKPVNRTYREHHEKVLAYVKENEIDVVIMDTNPELNLFNRLSFQSSDWVIIPIQAKEQVIKGASEVLGELYASFKSIHRDSKMMDWNARFVINEANGETPFFEEKRNVLFSNFGNRLFNHIIYNDPALGEASDCAIPFFFHQNVKPGSAKALVSIAMDILSGGGWSGDEADKRRMFLSEGALKR